MKRFEILDALRGILALDVTIGHLGVFPLFGSPHQSDYTLALLARAWNTTVFGPPAVVAFFIISGFCVHFPFAESGQVCAVGRFYARRYLRVLIPVIFVLALFKETLPSQTILLGRDSIIWDSTLWSLVCEEIYYALYPALSRLARITGWRVIIGAACVPMAVVVWWFFPAIDWNGVGIIGTTLTLFPVWLSGCHLAENVVKLNGNHLTWKIWAWRGIAWTTMWLALVLHFHTIFHQTTTGPLIGVVYYFWLRMELSYHVARKLASPLSWMGQWSYSLYLIHPIAIELCIKSGYLDLFAKLDWLAAFGITLLGAYVFYLLVERPSHRLARMIPLLDGTRSGVVLQNG